MKIRKARLSDLPELALLAQETYSVTFGHTLSKEELGKALQTRSEEYFQSRLNKDIILVAEIDGVLRGFIQFGNPAYEGINFDKGDVELNKIYVDQKFQGKGIGKGLMEAMLSQSRSKRAPHIYLDVYAENEKAIRLYKKYGFKIIGKTPFKVDDKIVGYDLLMKRSNGLAAI